MKDYLLLFNESEKLKRIINSDEFYDDEFKSTTTGERTLTFKMKDQVVDIEMGDKIGIFSECKFDLFIVDQVEAETYYSTDIKVTCLHDFYSIQEQKAITQYYSEKATLRESITEILRGTEYVLGECPERAIKPIGPYLYKNPLWCIQDIVSNFNVEVDYSIELNGNRNGISRKVLNIVNALGSDTGIRCSTDLNVSKIKRVHKKKFYTVMYGCGAEYQKDLVKYKYDFKDAVWTTSNNPADKPKGQAFVEDKEAIAKYGRKIGIFEDGRIKEPELLLKKTWEALQKNNKPFVSYELDIEELKTEDGYEHLNFRLGDLIILQNTIDNSRAKFRIVEDCKSIRNKYKRKLVVGEQVRGIFSGGDTGNSDGTEGPGGSVIEPGTGEDIKPPSIEEILPDTLPAIPVVTARGLWKDVQLSWTYENKIYYDYEVYASRIRDFEPTVFHMIYSGKASAFLHEAGANETWYYRVRAVNSFGNATQFSEQVESHTTKVSDGTKYFDNAAIKDALIEELRLDRGWIGTLRGHYIDARELSVTDGNGKRTLDVDSFGNVNLDVHTLKIKAKEVGTKEDINSAINLAEDNMLANSNFLKYNGKINGWTEWTNNENTNIMLKNYIWENGEGVGLYNPIKLNSILEFHSDYMKVGGIGKIAISFLAYREESVATAKVILRQVDDQFNVISDLEFGIPELYDGRLSHVFEITDDRVKWIRFILHHGGTWQDTPTASAIYFNRVMISIGDKVIPWKASNLDQLTNRYSKIESDMNEINLEVGAKVNSTDIISAINLSPERIKINSNNIDISGVTTMGNSASGRYVTIENEDYSVYNGNIRCLHFGYMNWQGREGLPEFLMGANGMNYNSTGNDRSGNYFGMAGFTREKNPNGWNLDFHRLYYKRAGNEREIKIDMAEDGRMVVNTEHSLALFDKGYEYLRINHGNGGLLLDNGFVAGKYDRCTFLKDIVVEGGMCHNDLQQGVCVRRYGSYKEYAFRPTTTHAIDLGTYDCTWRNLHYHGQLIYHGLRSSSPVMLCRSLSDSSDISQSVLTYEDYFNYVKDTPLIENESGSGVAIIADYNNTSDTNIRDKYMYSDDTIDQVALLGVYQVALKEACLKISELENFTKSLVERIEKLESRCVNAK